MKISQRSLLLLALAFCVVCFVSPAFGASDYVARRDKAQWQAILAYFRIEPETYLFHSNEMARYDLLMMQLALTQPSKLRGIKKQSLMMQKQQWVKEQRVKGGFVPSASMVIYLEMLLEAEHLTALSPPALTEVSYRYSWQPRVAMPKGGLQ